MRPATAMQAFDMMKRSNIVLRILPDCTLLDGVNWVYFVQNSVVHGAEGSKQGLTKSSSLAIIRSQQPENRRT